MPREYAHKLLELCQAGALDSYEVLENVLTNYLSSDEADNFALDEYGDFVEEEEEEDEYDRDSEFDNDVDD